MSKSPPSGVPRKAAASPAVPERLLANASGMWANVVGFLKEQRRPVSLADLRRAGFTTLESMYPEVLAALKTVANIKHDAAAGTYQFIFEYDLAAGRPALLRLLELNRARHGFQLHELLESYPGNLQADVEELEMARDLLLVRHADWKKWRIYHNDKALTTPMDVEFRDMWEKTELPQGDGTVESELAREGLKVQVAEKAKVAETDGKKKRRGGNRKIKIVNTHLADLGIGGQGRSWRSFQSNVSVLFPDLTKDFVPNT